MAREYLPHVLLSLAFGCASLTIGALSTPSWVVSDFAESIKLGVVRSCRKAPGQVEWCGWSRNSHGAWFFLMGTSALALLVLLTASVFLIRAIKVNSHIRRYHDLFDKAKWLSLGAFMLFCLGTVVFPIGFEMDEIGGSPYRLPPHMDVGSSYGMYFSGVLLSLISQILAGRICTYLHFF